MSLNFNYVVNKNIKKPKVLPYIVNAISIDDYVNKMKYKYGYDWYNKVINTENDCFLALQHRLDNINNKENLNTNSLIHTQFIKNTILGEYNDINESQKRRKVII